MGNWASMGPGGGIKRMAIVIGASAVLGFMLRAAGVTLLLPLLMPVPALAMGYYSMKANQPPRCPNCDLRLSYRRLGSGHGMLECPALCGYRKLVEGGPRRP
jgi:hypothetical protein